MVHTRGLASDTSPSPRETGGHHGHTDVTPQNPTQQVVPWQEGLHLHARDRRRGTRVRRGLPHG